MQDTLQVGRIVGTHGVRGEVRLEAWLDSPDSLCAVKTLFLREQPVSITQMRPHKHLILLKLEGVDDIPAAQALRGEILWAERSALPLPPGRFFIQDLIGMAVTEEETGAPVGTVEDVWKGPSQDVFVVRGAVENRQILIPHVDAFVKRIDADARQVFVRLIEGM